MQRWYMQDDSWGGVTTDHLKLWTINIDWANPSNSSISSPVQLNTTALIALLTVVVSVI